MALPVFNTGDVPTALQVNNYFVNTLFVRKGSTETVNSTTALQDDDALLMAVDVNTTYEVHLLARYASQLADDFKFGFTAPAGATWDYAVATTDIAGTGYNNDTFFPGSLADVFSVGGLGGSTCAALFHGLLITSGTAGTFRFRWAQVVSSASGTSVLSGSYLIMRRVA